MDTLLQHFQWALQALAAPAEQQLALFPDFVCKADELALDFDHWLSCAADHHGESWSTQQWELLDRLDQRLDAMSGPDRAHLWSEQAVSDDPAWEEVRGMAQAVLGAFGWPPGIPPTGRSTYISEGAA